MGVFVYLLLLFLFISRFIRGNKKGETAKKFLVQGLIISLILGGLTACGETSSSKGDSSSSSEATELKIKKEKEKKAKEEQKAKEEAEKKAKEEQVAKEATEKKAKEEQAAREEAERQAQANAIESIGLSEAQAAGYGLCGFED